MAVFQKMQWSSTEISTAKNVSKNLFVEFGTGELDDRLASIEEDMRKVRETLGLEKSM